MIYFNTTNEINLYIVNTYYIKGNYNTTKLINLIQYIDKKNVFFLVYVFSLYTFSM